MGSDNSADPAPVPLLQRLSNELRRMQYNDTQRSVGEVDASYRNGWNDAMRSAVRAVEARLIVVVTCTRCDWSTSGRVGPDAERLLRKHVQCPSAKCKSPLHAVCALAPEES